MNNTSSLNHLDIPPESLFLVLPVPLRKINNELYYEEQACMGISRWADNFPHVISANPLIPENQAVKEKTIIWKPISTIPNIEKIEFIPLPWAYKPLDFIKTFNSTKKNLTEYIQKSTYLHFAIGGFFGDWGSVAAFQAYCLSKPYTTHMDWVTHRVQIQSLSPSDRFLKRIKCHFDSFLAHHWNNFVISKSALAICNGMNVFNYYKNINKNPFMTHDIHYSLSNCIAPADLNEKKSHVLQSKKLKVCYTGRMVPMKAPLDWLKAIASAVKNNIQIEARWYGDGPMHGEFLSEIERLNLKNIVTPMGFVSDRNAISHAIRDADIFLMTHISEESPRCLVESLMQGTPVVGYYSDSASNLIQKDKAGLLCKTGDWEALGDLIKEVDLNRSLLPPLVENAAEEGKKYSEEVSFLKRSEKIKQVVLKPSTIS